MYLLFGCSPQYHLTKYQKKGGTIDCDTTYVNVPIFVKGKDGKDSIVYQKTPCNCPEAETPPTNRQVKLKYKFDNRRFEDYLKAVTKRLKARENFIIDSMRIDNKNRKIDAKAFKNKDKNDTKEATQWSKTINLALWVGLILIVLFILAKIFKRFL